MVGNKHCLPACFPVTSLAWVAIVIVCAWQSIAMNTIIYISGLQTVPEDVYEAGAIDGATGFSKFRYPDIPADRSVFPVSTWFSV